MRKMRRITVQQRRRGMVRRHHLAGDAGGPDAVVQALVALHATDPASVYLSVLARNAVTRLPDVAEAMYARRSLVRCMAMRRTLFVFAREDIPMIQAAVSTDVAATLRRRLISQLEHNGSEPPIGRDIARWLADLEAGVEEAITARGAATGAELAAEQTALKTRILAPTASEQPHNVTTPPADPHGRRRPACPQHPNGGLDEPTSPLGTGRPLVAPGAARDRPSTGPTGSRATVPRPIRTSDDRGPSVGPVGT
jgi:winged helix DNA-binding protein